MIQLGGLASGLDTNAIIQAILGVERVPINALQADKRGEEGKLSLIGTIKGLVSSLRDKASDLSTSSGFLSYSVTSSDDAAASFSVTGAPQTGNHTLVVNQLATADRYTFTDSVTDPDAVLGTADGQQITFDVNDTSYSLSIDQADSSLNDIRDAINDLAGDDVTASVINTGTSGSPQYQLVLAGDDTGEDAEISNLTSAIGGMTTVLQLTDASNAQIEIDGLTVERSTNVFDDVLDGLSFTAQVADSVATIAFGADVDDDGIKTKIQGFVDSYNEVIDFINDQNTFTEEDGVGGALFGDSILRNVKSTISNALFDVDIDKVVADSAGFSTLSLVGIDLDSKGKLSINSATFDAKLAEDPEAFADLFVDDDGFDNTGAANNTAAFFTDTTTDDGVFDNLFRSIDQIVDDLVLQDGSSVKGLFDVRTESINDAIERINDRITVLQDRLVDTEASLVARFASLESIITGLNAQGSALSSLQL
ncbi:MAG: flagellar hook-associated protein 2 [Planctomycetota bacterium]|jgi:flagellar hook-associated protein 2